MERRRDPRYSFSYDMAEQRTFRLTCPLMAVKKVGASFELATLLPDAVVVYRGNLGLAEMAEVDCEGDVYGVFLVDLEQKASEFSSGA